MGRPRKNKTELNEPDLINQATIRPVLSPPFKPLEIEGWMRASGAHKPLHRSNEDHEMIIKKNYLKLIVTTSKPHQVIQRSL